MRVLLPLLFFLVITLVAMPTIGMVMNFTNITNTSIINSTQVQSIVHNIPAPPANLFPTILNFAVQLYNSIVNFIQENLQNTLLKENPSLASSYANVIAWLTTLTAIYIILTLFEVARKFIRLILVIGWAFVIVSLLLAH